MLTGNKDVDRKILNKLEDNDLVKVCQVNKQANTLCNDQVFWMNRVFNRFGYVGGDVLRSNKKNRSWSDYYINDLRKIIKNTALDYLTKGSDNERLDHVIIALKNGAYIHYMSDWALRNASDNGDIEMVKYLLSRGANIHANGDQSVTLASKNGDLEMVKYLVSNGGNLNSNALQQASQYGHLDVVKYLVEHNIPIHGYFLMWASRRGHLDVVKYLVEKGADIHFENDYALREAIRLKRLDVAEYLKSLQ